MCNAIAGTINGGSVFCAIRRPCRRHDKPAPGGEEGPRPPSGLLGNKWVPIGQDPATCEHPQPWTPVRVGDDADGRMCHACCKVMEGGEDA